MTEPSERDLLAAVKALYPRANQTGPFDEKERRIAAAIAAAREEGRLEAEPALRQLLAEVIAAGFATAKDYNWPTAIADARAALLHQGRTITDERSLSSEKPKEEQ